MLFPILTRCFGWRQHPGSEDHSGNIDMVVGESCGKQYFSTAPDLDVAHKPASSQASQYLNDSSEVEAVATCAAQWQSQSEPEGLQVCPGMICQPSTEVPCTGVNCSAHNSSGIPASATQKNLQQKPDQKNAQCPTGHSGANQQETDGTDVNLRRLLACCQSHQRPFTSPDLLQEVQQLTWLGAGASGVVYSGTWQGVPVAVKFIVSDTFDHQVQSTREAVVSRSVGHPCVVHTYAYYAAKVTSDMLHLESPHNPDSASELVMRQNRMLSMSALAEDLLSLDSETTDSCPPSAINNMLSKPAALPDMPALLGVPKVSPRRVKSMAGGWTSGGLDQPGLMPRHAAVGSYDGTAHISLHHHAHQQYRPYRHVPPKNSSHCQLSTLGNTAPAALTSLPTYWAASWSHGMVGSIGAAVAAGAAIPLGSPVHRASSTARSPVACPMSPEAASVAFSMEALEAVPDQGTRDQAAGMRLAEVLHRLGARPGQYLTVLIMEKCEGSTLLQAIEDGNFKVLGGSRSHAMLALVQTARDIALGCHHLHSLNIIHGDLKPSNVLLKAKFDLRERGFHAKVSDFGLATQNENAEGPDRIMRDQGGWGTVAYMAPEMLGGQQSKASDVYSYGVLLWQMCSGQLPYENLRLPQVLMGIKMNSISLNWPETAPAGLRKLGTACMDRDPQSRPTFEWIANRLSCTVEQLQTRISQKQARRQSTALSHMGQDNLATPVHAVRAVSSIADSTEARRSQLGTRRTLSGEASTMGAWQGASSTRINLDRPAHGASMMLSLMRPRHSRQDHKMELTHHSPAAAATAMPVPTTRTTVATISTNAMSTTASNTRTHVPSNTTLASIQTACREQEFAAARQGTGTPLQPQVPPAVRSPSSDRDPRPPQPLSVGTLHASRRPALLATSPGVKTISPPRAAYRQAGDSPPPINSNVMKLRFVSSQKRRSAAAVHQYLSTGGSAECTSVAPSSQQLDSHTRSLRGLADTTDTMLESQDKSGLWEHSSIPLWSAQGNSWCSYSMSGYSEYSRELSRTFDRPLGAGAASVASVAGGAAANSSTGGAVASSGVVGKPYVLVPVPGSPNAVVRTMVGTPAINWYSCK